MAVATLFPLLPQEGRDLAKSAAATAAMISNYYFTTGIDYFSPQAEINPLLHTWSLGVEEQYYLLAPAFMGGIVAWAARRNWDATRALIWGGAVAIAFSYVTLAILSGHDRRLAFFSIMTRSWQFAAGGMLAIAVLKGTPVPARLRSALGVAGLLAVAASVLLYHEHMSYPGAPRDCCRRSARCSAGLRSRQRASAAGAGCLASRPAVAIGVLSYSWYLWHWPLIELMRTLPIGQESLWKDVASSTVALLLSVPTYLLLERPLKTLRRPEITRPFGGRIVAAGVGGSALIAVLALLLARSPVYERTLQAIHPGAPSERRHRLPARPEPAEVQPRQTLRGRRVRRSERDVHGRFPRADADAGRGMVGARRRQSRRRARA